MPLFIDTFVSSIAKQAHGSLHTTSGDMVSRLLHVTWFTTNQNPTLCKSLKESICGDIIIKATAYNKLALLPRQTNKPHYHSTYGRNLLLLFATT